MGFLFSALIPVDFRAVDTMLGRRAPISPVSSRPGSAAVPPGSLPWLTPGVCAGASCVVSGFPTLMFAICCLLCSWPCPTLRRGGILAFSPSGFGAPLQLLEESLYLLPDFPAAAQAPPAHSDEAHEAVALVHGNQEVFPRSPHPVYQERLHVPLHPRQHRVALFQFLPGAQFQERFRRPHRAGIERDYPPGRRAVEEERHVHRNSQALPLHVAHLEVLEEEVTVGYEPIPAFARRFAIEEDGTRPAGAHHLPRGDLHQVPVLGRYRLAAQIAVLLGGLRRLLFHLLGLFFREPAQREESGESLPFSLFDHILLSPLRSVGQSLLC